MIKLKDKYRTNIEKRPLKQEKEMAKRVKIIISDFLIS